MGRAKGTAKTGGRVKGTPNKVTRDHAALVEQIRFDQAQRELDYKCLSGLEYLQKHCDPIKIMIEVIAHPRCTLELKSRTAAELCKYLYTPRKAVEVSGPDGQPLRNKIEIVVTRIDQDISQLPPPAAGGPIIDILKTKE